MEKDISKVEREVMKVLTKEDVPGFIEKMRKLCEEEKADEFWENYHANVDNINHIIKTERLLGKKEGIAVGEEKGIKKGINEGKKLGKKEGLQKGKTIGIKQGKAIGIREGEAAKTFEIVRNMLNINFPIELITTSTGLTEKEVLKIKNSIMNEKIVTASDESNNEVLAL